MKKSLLLVVCILPVFTTNGQQISEAKVVKVKMADTSKHRSPFWKAFEANSPKSNNQQENYKKIKLDRTTYTSTYLKASGIMPNNDAIALIKKINPSLGDSVLYGTYLKLPELGKVTAVQNRELIRNLKEMNKYDEKDHAEFIREVVRFDSLYALLKETKLNMDSVKDPKEFVVILDDLNKHLIKKVKLSKGRYQVMNKNLSIVLKVLDKCMATKTVMQMDVFVLQICNREIISGFYELTGNRTQNKLQEACAGNKRSSRQKSFNVAALPDINREIDSDDQPATFFSSYADINKTCYIYALSANEAEDEIIELQHQFYYAYLCVADALWDCYYSNCSGFTEENQDVSFSTLNISVAHYIFKFRDKTTGKIYWRCYKQDDFKIYDKNGRQLDKDEVMIIFNPGAEDCKNWIQ